ncbi:hypothetical protein P7K49_020740 [Saguinus oedipus]|uniref:Uncharacterized protein n=1 Tax=Saguinus oedipus TaxID=9490 RepID=A0ABQ9UQM9_SAGOE|nr:hypothetical protein P7K49_020740 [Saguinus oedipus]
MRTKPDLPTLTQLYPPHHPHQGLCIPPNFLRGLSVSQKPNLTVIPLLGDEETQKQVAQKDSDAMAAPGGFVEKCPEGKPPTAGFGKALKGI